MVKRNYVGYDDYVALEQEVERLKAERDSIAQDSASDRMRIQRLVEGAKQKDADLAALVTALDEATKCTYCDGRGAYQAAEDVDSSYFDECPNCRGKGRFYENITPASRAVAEKWVEKEER